MSDLGIAPLSPDATDWTALDESGVRNDIELPWLRKELEIATDNGLHDIKPGREYWLGYREALRVVIERPRLEIEAANARIIDERREKEEQEQNARRVRAGHFTLRRVRDWVNERR